MKNIWIEPKTKEAYELLHEGTKVLTDIEENGIHIDIEYCHKAKYKLQKRCEVIKTRIRDNKFVRSFVNNTGRPFNFESPKQLSNFLYDHLKIKSNRITEKGSRSTDESTLKKIDLPITNDILQYKKLNKAISTYLNNFIVESHNGILHPFFNLYLALTFRSSSSNINFQNIPRRIKELNRLLRRAIIPPPGALINESDYSGIEVAIAYCYHQDPNMKEELLNDDKDMHGDMAKEIFFLQESTKACRDCAKNKFVFPEFYGDFYEDCAINIWEYIELYDLKNTDELPMKKHLKNNNINGLKDFIEHIREIENKFWNERFPVYTNWKKEWYNRYLINGFFNTFTGFTCKGLMKKNKVINYAIQGSAFHCLLWSLIQIHKELKKQKAKSRIFGQIHDSICSYIYPDEFNDVMKLINRVTTKDLLNRWDWISIPLKVEHEATRIDESWYMKKELINKRCDCGSRWIQKENKQCPICSN